MVENFRIGKYFRTDLAKAIYEVSENQNEVLQGPDAINSMRAIVEAINRVRPRMSKQVAESIIAIACHSFEKGNPGNVGGNISGYLEGFNTICSLFAKTDVGKEELDLLILSELIELVFRRADVEFTKEISDDLLDRLEKYYYYLYEKSLKYYQKPDYGMKPLFRLFNVQDVDASCTDARNATFEKIVNLINSKTFVPFQETAFKFPAKIL